MTSSDHRNNHRGGSATDEATGVVQRSLRGATHLGREQLGNQGAVAANHAVGEHAHEEAADEQRRGIGELAVDDDHRSSANLERPECGTTAGLVGQETEGRNADHHAQNRHGSPQTRRRKAQAELRVQIFGEPRHNSEIAGILNGAQDNDDDRELSALRRGEQVTQLAVGLARCLVLLINRRLGNERTNDDCDNGGNETDHEQAAPAKRRNDGRRRERSAQHAHLEAQANGARAFRAILGARDLGCNCHAQTKLGANAQTSEEAAKGHYLEVRREGRTQGKHAKKNDRIRKNFNSAIFVSKFSKNQTTNEGASQRDGGKHACSGIVDGKRRHDARKREAQNHKIQAVKRMAHSSRENGLACIVLHFRSLAFRMSAHCSLSADY